MEAEPPLITFWILLALVALRWSVLLVGAALLVRPVTDCPACFQCTFLLRTPWLQRLAPSFEWRWCPQCGWEGLARRQPPRPQLPFTAGPVRPPADVERKTEAA